MRTPEVFRNFGHNLKEAPRRIANSPRLRLGTSIALAFAFTAGVIAEKAHVFDAVGHFKDEKIYDVQFGTSHLLMDTSWKFYEWSNWANPGPKEDN